MARVVLMPTATSNLDEIFEYCTRFNAAGSAGKIKELTSKLRILEHAPLLGRPLTLGLRELLIGHRRHTYIVRYRYEPAQNIVYVTSIRSSSQSSLS
jgi:toxin ParE1/3/4